MDFSFARKDPPEVSAFEPESLHIIKESDIFNFESIDIGEKILDGCFQINKLHEQFVDMVAIMLTGMSPSKDEVAVTGSFGKVEHAHIQWKIGYIIIRTSRIVTGIVVAAMGTTMEDEARHETDKICIRWTVQLADAVDYLHNKGIVHRDINPKCCLIDGKKNLKLADLGSSKLKEDLNYPFHRFGTAAYCPPEMLEENISSQAGDVYSFLMTAIYAATRRPPFDEHQWLTMSFNSVCEHIKQTNRMRTSELNATKYELLGNAIMTDPHSRPNMESLCQFLDKVDSSTIVKYLRCLKEVKNNVVHILP